MERTIEIKRWDNGRVIFSHTCENNTLVHTITEAIKQGVSLSYADFHNNILNCIDFANSDLSYTNFSNCELIDSVLTNATLTGADFTKVYLSYTDISYKQLTDIKGINDQCPKEGSFIGWKKCKFINRNYPYIVKLEIPTDAKRSSGTTNKCRCSHAKVLEIQNIDGTKADVTRVFSIYDEFFYYQIGEMIYSDSFDDNFWKECSYGIHFFMNREDAVNY